MSSPELLFCRAHDHLHSSSQLIVDKDLLCARHCTKHWEHNRARVDKARPSGYPLTSGNTMANEPTNAPDGYQWSECWATNKYGDELESDWEKSLSEDGKNLFEEMIFQLRPER